MGESSGPVEDLLSHQWGYDATGRDSTFLTAFTLLLMLSFLLSWVLTQRWQVKLLPEACVVLTVGLGGGFVCKGAYGVTQREFFTKPLLDFDNALFFLGLLPPIIFNSGYDLHPRWLFGLFGPILWYALAGTLISAVIVGSWLAIVSQLGWGPEVSFAETLSFGALISATDPVSVLAVFLELKVDPKMFYLVFGESVLNDAVGIVLFKTFSKYVGEDTKWTSLFIAIADFFVIFLGSMLLGFASAVIASLSLRALRLPYDIEERRTHARQAHSHTKDTQTPQQSIPRSMPDRIEDTTDSGGRPRDTVSMNNDEIDDAEIKEEIEASRRSQLGVLLTCVWLPAFLAELVQLSGIVATLFAAIGVRHWGMPNLQEYGPHDTKQSEQVESMLSTLAHLADTAVFLYLGLSVPAAVNDWRKHYSHAFVAWAILACIVGRAVQIYALSHIANHQALQKVRRAFRDGTIRGGRDSARKALDAATIPKPMQHMLFFSGLRGAVAFSCAHIFPNKAGHRPLFEVTTTTIIIISMYILGATTVPVLKFLKIPTHCIIERHHPESPVMRSTSPWAGPSTPTNNTERDDERGRDFENQVNNPMASSSSSSVAEDVAPRPSEQLRRIAMLDSSYIYPALVRNTPRIRHKEPFASPTSSSSAKSNEPLNPNDPTDSSRSSNGAQQSLEMVSISKNGPASSSSLAGVSEEAPDAVEMPSAAVDLLPSPPVHPTDNTDFADGDVDPSSNTAIMTP